MTNPETIPSPAVATGGVTEERVRVAADTLQVALNRQGWITSGGLAERTARAILTASLAVGDEGIREGERFPVTLGKVHQAIDAYVQALVDRQHGGVAQDRAFNAICEALGRSPTAEMDARRLPTPPSRGEGE